MVRHRARGKVEVGRLGIAPTRRARPRSGRRRGSAVDGDAAGRMRSSCAEDPPPDKEKSATRGAPSEPARPAEAWAIARAAALA